MNEKIKLLFTSSRPLSWVNTAFPFAAGYLYFTQSVDAVFIIGSLFFLIPYNVLMYGINDVYDYESDLRNPRKGGVEGAVVAKKYHRFLLTWSYAIPIPFVTALVLLGNPASAITLAACLFFVVAYSVKGLRFKEVPVLDSMTSSLHFVGPLIFALSLVGWPSAAWPIVIAFFLWGVASQSFGAIQDIQADREAELRSVATVLGAKRTLWFSLVSYLLAAILATTLGVYGVIVGVAGLAYVANLLPYLQVSDKSSEITNRGWKRFLWINYVVGAVVTISLVASTGILQK